MCELLGMSANVPTDIYFSFAGLVRRGGETGPHGDGWGIAFYDGKAGLQRLLPSESGREGTAFAHKADVAHCPLPVAR